MYKRLLTVFTVVLMLVVFSVALAQDAPSGEPIFVLTEDQINAHFTIPSTDTRQISNLVADVQEDGVHLTFELTIISDGTSNTLSIIAVLIGLYRPEVSALELENTMVSNFTASPRQRQAVTSLITRAWRNYARDAFAAARVGGKMHLEDVSLGYHADGIYFYATDGVTN